MNDYLKHWIDLVKKHNKEGFIYKRELLIEKKIRWKFLPNTSRIFSYTIGADIIPVQPIEASIPKGTLFYMDYNYDLNEYDNILLIEKIKKSEQ